MSFLILLLKILIIPACLLLMAAPLLLEYRGLKKEKERKISYKRFRVIVFTLLYALAVTIVLAVLADLLGWVGNLSPIRWLAQNVPMNGRFSYCCSVLGVVLLNFGIGFLFRLLLRLVRIGLKKKDLIHPRRADGKFTLRQQAEIKVIRFFHNETWFFVADVLKRLNILLSIGYAVLFTVHLLAAIIDLPWPPYSFILSVFGAGYLFPIITLLVLWEFWFFLEGIRWIEDECPELLRKDFLEEGKKPDLDAIDEEAQRRFARYFSCKLNVSGKSPEKTEEDGESPVSTKHEPLTDFIAQAVETDARDPQRRNEIYMDCTDVLVREEQDVIINGSLFSEFSAYFFRYLSIVLARGDNVVFVCDTDDRAEDVCRFLEQRLSRLTSPYCKDFGEDRTVDFDDPIWKIIRINGEHPGVEEAAVNGKSVLVTTLRYLCSTKFEDDRRPFLHLISTVVYVDSVRTVNLYSMQMAAFHTRLRHLSGVNARLSRNGTANPGFGVRYLDRPPRYICFDETKTPGLDKVLKNLFSAEFRSMDASAYNTETLVRCYTYEGAADSEGKRVCPQYLKTQEDIGPLMNMALLCLANGVSSVTVFTGESLPYENLMESIDANRGRFSVAMDDGCIRLNRHSCDPDAYTVTIAFDAADDLPVTIRRCLMLGPKRPNLLMIFSRPYLLRECFVENLPGIWESNQFERIPYGEQSAVKVAERILTKANAGGITVGSLLHDATAAAEFRELANDKDVNGILREILKIYGLDSGGEANLFNFFEFASDRDFDDDGVYRSEEKILLRHQGTLYDLIIGKNRVVLMAGEYDHPLSLPVERITQNFIAGQNMLLDGRVYQIERIDVAAGVLHARLVTGGKNKEPFRYIQDREYRMEAAVEMAAPTKHLLLTPKPGGEELRVTIAVFRAPMEVLTSGYSVVSPQLLAPNECRIYQSILEDGADDLAKQTYRVYGDIHTRTYSPDSILKKTELVSSENGALAMAVHVECELGEKADAVMQLAAIMLNEILHGMFPSVADSIAVCPILKGSTEDLASDQILRLYPKLKTIGSDDVLTCKGFSLLIIEDSPVELGVISTLTASGEDCLHILFGPILDFLSSYDRDGASGRYLLFGRDRMPAWFDLEGLRSVAEALGDNRACLHMESLDALVEYETCDFCGTRYLKGKDIQTLDDGRKMCRSCADSRVGSSKELLRRHLRQAENFLESTYGIRTDRAYEFCFESTEKVANALKRSGGLLRRGADVPLLSYVVDKKKVHIETSIPPASLDELLVRALTHVWQLANLRGPDESLAEGQIALVSLQYLRFCRQIRMASLRSRYYESTANLSGRGYRRLVQELLANPQFSNNSFRYLLKLFGGSGETSLIPPPAPHIAGDGDLGKPYVPAAPDRVIGGEVSYFYKSKLGGALQSVYDQLLAAIRSHADTVTVPGRSFTEVDRVIDCIRYDHPELYYFCTFSMCGEEVSLTYGATAEETAAINERIEAAAAAYLEGIDDSMSAYDVALRLHIRIIDAVDYDTVALNREKAEGGRREPAIDPLRSIYGVFLDKKAVCEGYARAMQFLLQRAGVECAECVGTTRRDGSEPGGGHAWNILRIDGDYYYLDTTWDDSSDTIQSVKISDFGLDYFCITSEELFRTRTDESPLTPPLCTAVRANYYYHNDLVLDSYDLTKLKKLAQTAAADKRSCITFKCTSQPLYEEAQERLCISGSDAFELIKVASKTDKRISDTGYTFSYDKNIWTITIRFKYKT